MPAYLYKTLNSHNTHIMGNQLLKMVASVYAGCCKDTHLNIACSCSVFFENSFNSRNSSFNQNLCGYYNSIIKCKVIDALFSKCNYLLSH